MPIELISERLKDLKESNKQVERLIERVANIDSQTGTVSFNEGRGGDDGVLSELVAEILQMIKEQEDDLELLTEEVQDLAGAGKVKSVLANEQKILLQEIREVDEELKLHQRALRYAQLVARQKLEAAQKEERIALTRSYLLEYQNPTNPTLSTTMVNDRPNPSSRARLLSNNDKEINASSDITIALRRTHELMANELSRSQFAHETLQESTVALAQLSETYSSLDSMLLTSRNLLGTLLRSQKSDTWYLETAFYVLLFTIIWLVFRRLLFWPMLWFFWYPMKMFIKGWKGVALTIKAREWI